MKKLLSVILALSLLVSAFAVSVIAVTEEDGAAKIGDTYYATLAEAVKAVAKGEKATIELLCDQKITNIMIGHSYAQDITIDLGGHTLSSTGRTLTSYRSGTVLTLANGTVSGNATQGTLCATYGGDIIIEDNVNVVCAGGAATAIYVDNGSLTVNGANVNLVTGKTSVKISDNANNVVTIAGGTYKTEIPAEWCADGCAAVLTDGNYTVKAFAAKIADAYYDTLTEAIAAAKDGDTITVINNIAVDKADAAVLDGKYPTFFCVTGKTITIDLNGKKIAADAAGLEGLVVGVFSAEDDGHLTLCDSVGTASVSAVANGATVYSLIASYDPTSSVTINGGNYSLDEATDSLMYTHGNEALVVNGGSFYLGNVGTGKNYSPWIFNAKGQNTAHVLVNGGSFNADVQHQYYPFEVLVAKEYALAKDNGTYTIVPAVAYVNEQEFSSKWYTNEIGYASLEEAIAAVEAPKTSWNKKVSDQEFVTLLSDIEISSTISIEKDVIIDLNGKTITAVTDGSDGVYSDAFYILADVTFKNGSVDARKNDGYAFFIGNADTAGKLTIESGEYFGSPTVAQVNQGELIVNGGYFEAVEYNGEHEFTLNCKDAYYREGAAKITVNGGTFYKFDPADNASEGEGTNYCSEGSTVTVLTEKAYYKVGDTYYTSFMDAIANAPDGATIVLIQDANI